MVARSRIRLPLSATHGRVCPEPLRRCLWVPAQLCVRRNRRVPRATRACVTRPEPLPPLPHPPALLASSLQQFKYKMHMRAWLAATVAWAPCAPKECKKSVRQLRVSATVASFGITTRSVRCHTHEPVSRQLWAWHAGVTPVQCDATSCAWGGGGFRCVRGRHAVREAVTSLRPLRCGALLQTVDAPTELAQHHVCEKVHANSLRDNMSLPRRACKSCGASPSAELGDRPFGARANVVGIARPLPSRVTKPTQRCMLRGRWTPGRSNATAGSLQLYMVARYGTTPLPQITVVQSVSCRVAGDRDTARERAKRFRG